MIAIIDYGVGNLFSLKSSFAAIGADVTVTSDPKVIAEADRLILPGVGAFEDAARKLRDSGLDEVIISEVKGGKHLLGICLGMQMLFDMSYEYGEHRGLGLISGSVKPIRPEISEELKIPHIGWNAIKTVNENPLTKGIDDGSCFYFVHSYMGMCEKPSQLYAVTEYGEDVTAIVGDGYVFGTQFHPEKSGEAGLHLLKNFVSLA